MNDYFMRIMLYAMLVCNTKSCRNKNVHLLLTPKKVVSVPTPYKQDLIKKLMGKLQYTHILYAAKCVCSSPVRIDAQRNI